MSEGKYGLRREIIDKYGKKEAIQYAKDVKSSTAFPGAQDLRKNLSNPEIKVKRIGGRFPYKTSEAYKTVTPAGKQQAERRLRNIQKDAAKSYTRKVAKETVEKTKKTLSKLSKASRASGVGIAIEAGTQYMKSKNQQRKLVKGFNELRSQNLRKG
jgi:hypothetical protein